MFALLIYIAIYVSCAAASFPSAILLTLIGGCLFGAFLGGTAAAVSATLGGLCAFLAARSAQPQLVAQARGFRSLAHDRGSRAGRRLLSHVPAPDADLPVLARQSRRGGRAAFGSATFLWTTFFGVMPGGFAFATAGEALGAILARQTRDLSRLRGARREMCSLHVDPAALVDQRLRPRARIFLGALALIPVMMKRIPPFARFCERRGWIRAASGGEP